MGILFRRVTVYPGQQPAKERTPESTNASQSRYVGGWHTTEKARRHTHEWTDLYKSWRLLSPESGIEGAAGHANRQIWAHEAPLSERHRKGLYTSLLLTEKLYPHLLEIDEAANKRMDILMPQLMKAPV